MYKYLIVDDEALIRKGTISKIGKLGLPVECCGESVNGAEAIDFLKNKKVDFVITDMDMPGVDGIQLLEFLHESFTHLPVLVISGYKKFSYLQKSVQMNAVDYILKPFDKQTLLESMNKLLVRLKEQEQNNSKSESIVLNYICGNTSPIGLVTLSKIIPDYKIIEYFIVLTDAQIGSMIDFTFQTNFQKINQTLLILTKHELNHLNQLSNSWFSVSDVIQQLGDANIYLNQCIQELNNRNIFTKGALHFSGNKNAINSLKYQTIQNKIVFYLESGEFEKLNLTYKTAFDLIVYENKESLMVIKLFSLETLNKVKKFINNYFEIDSNYTMPDIYEKVLNSIFIFDDLFDYFNNLFLNLSKSLATEKLYSSKNIIVNVCEYLQNHYKEDISLSFISDIFHLNSSYLSTIFKEQTNVSFTTYLNSLRIDEAKEKLVSTKHKASTISKQVGFDNDKYFYRVFKKHSNYTPEQYRKKFT